MKADGQPKRKLRNYLLDPKFQLKFTSLVVGAGIVVASLFGGFLWSTTKRLLAEAESVVEARSRAAETSRELGNATLNNELLQRFEDPAFVEQLRQQSQKIDAQYEFERTEIIAQKAKLLEQQRTLLLSLIGGLAAMVFFLAVLTIMATHKIVGPLYRLKRLFEAVTRGKLVEPPQFPREGDEFKHLFESFGGMMQSLRSAQQQELVAVENVIDRAERTGVSPEVLRLLKAMAEQMKGRMEK